MRKRCEPKPTRPSVGDEATWTVVVPWLEGGGAQAALLGLMRRAPVRPRVIVLFAGSRWYEEVARQAIDLVLLGHPRSIRGVLRAARGLTTQLQDSTKVYSLMRASHLVIGLLPVRLLRRIELVATLHQLPSADASGVRGRLEDLLVGRALKNAVLVTAPSARAVDEARLRFRLPSAKVQYEENQLELRSVEPEPVRAGRLDSLRLAFVGRIEFEKGLDRLPALLAGVATPVHLRILGSGSQLPAVRRSTAQIPAPHVVEFLGHADPGPTYTWCDALLLPSRAELNPVVVWEAWASGREVVASDIEAFRDLASVGPVSVFTNSRDLDRILQSIAQHGIERLHRSSRARRASVQGHGRSVIIDRFWGTS